MRTSLSSKNDIFEYILEMLNYHLRNGESPLEALEKTVASYAYVVLDIERLAMEVRAQDNIDLKADQLGPAILELRNLQGLTLRDLAEKSGSSASNICRIENSSHIQARLSTLKSIAKGLGYRLEIRLTPDEGEDVELEEMAVLQGGNAEEEK